MYQHTAGVARRILGWTTWGLVSWLACGVAVADVIHVDDDAALGGDGTLWTTAYKHLQDALAVATASDEIRIAGGTYTPDQGGGMSAGDRLASFHLLSGVAIYGGYAGLAQPGDPDARDVALYESILTGDLGGDDDSNDVFANRGDNSYHVVIASNTDASARLDGVTITGGFAVAYDGQPNGGGVYMVDGSATFAGCTIRHNATYSGYPLNNVGQPTGDGAGVYCQGGAPSFTDCSVVDNAAGAGKNSGDGMYYPIRAATAGGDGGGFCFRAAQAVLTGCTLTRNRAGNGGNGLDQSMDGGGANGAAGGNGGAVYAFENSTVALTDCTMTNNRAGTGGNGWPANYVGGSAGVAGTGGAVYANASTTTLARCNLAGNTSGIGGNGGGAFESGSSGTPGASGGGGGALYATAGTLDVSGCSFTDNWTGSGGHGGYGATGGVGGTGGRGGDGAAAYITGTATIRNCSFSANVTGNGGNGGDGSYIGDGGTGGNGGDAAGVCLVGAQSVITLADCVLGDNLAGNGGVGGDAQFDGSGGNAGRSAGIRSGAQLTLRNCTIAYNEVGEPGDPNGAGALTGGLELVTGGTATIENTILWGNIGDAPSVETQQIAGTPTAIHYCDVEGWTGALGGTGNFALDPAFADPNANDYHLTMDSPCIDAGNPGFVPLPGETDIDGQPRVMRGGVDIGADEVPPSAGRGDVNCDGVVGFGDINPFVLLLSNPAVWAETYPGCPSSNGDINEDGTVGFADINPFVALLASR